MEEMKKIHDWNVPPREAAGIQRTLSTRVVRKDRLGEVRHVAGVDVGFREGKTRAAVAVLDYPGLSLVDHAIAHRPTEFPYVPGLLSFREAPAVLDALGRLSIRPDLLLCDGQGIAHPRRFGIACHLGVLTDIPSIGVAKSRLIGTYAEPGNGRSDWSALMDGNETIGAVLRTRPHVKPLFISIGHRINLETAIAWVMACCTRYRLPETTRSAHRLASEC
jgi:deoxyribonuclease V